MTIEICKFSASVSSNFRVFQLVGFSVLNNFPLCCAAQLSALYLANG